MKRRVEVKQIARHRNGVGGEPFHVVLFLDKDQPATPGLGGKNRDLFVGIVFEQRGEGGAVNSGRVAVLNVGRLIDGDIAFGSNSWRGDQYEDVLRRAIAESEGGV